MKKEVKNTVKNLELIPVTNDQQNEAQMLQDEIEKRTKELEKCLQVLEAKKKLSMNRNVFITVMDKLEAAEDKLTQDTTFDTEDFKLKFASASNYRDEDVFCIGNRDLMLEFVRFIRVKVIDKIRDIEQQLVS